MGCGILFPNTGLMSGFIKTLPSEGTHPRAAILMFIIRGLFPPVQCEGQGAECEVGLTWGAGPTQGGHF